MEFRVVICWKWTSRRRRSRKRRCWRWFGWIRRKRKREFRKLKVFTLFSPPQLLSPVPRPPYARLALTSSFHSFYSIQFSANRIMQNQFQLNDARGNFPFNRFQLPLIPPPAGNLQHSAIRLNRWAVIRNAWKQIDLTQIIQYTQYVFILFLPQMFSSFSF